MDRAKAIGEVTTPPFGVTEKAAGIRLGGGASWSDVRLRSMLGRGHEEETGGTLVIPNGPTITGLRS
jgi:hypothetical protein